MPLSLRARRLIPAAVAVAVCLAHGLMVVRPALSAEEQRELAGRYAFAVETLNTAPENARSQRQVAPELAHIQHWISAVGAAVALADVRGLGRDADVCLVDPRDDSVTLRPLPHAGGPSYPPIRLEPTGLPYDRTMAPMGCVPVDIDEDGTVDLIVYYWGRSPVIFLNGGVRADGGPGAFQPVELVEPMQVWNTAGLNIGDVDGDGHVDILVANYFPDGARVLDPNAADDPRIRMQDSMGLARNAGVNRLLLTRPTGQPHTKPVVIDASAALPDDAARSWTLATGFQDLTSDGLPEIYQANDFGPDQLLVNHSEPGNVRLTEVKGRRDLFTPKSEVLGNDSFKGMGVAFTYPTGTGLPMMVVSNITSPYALHESNLAFVPTGDGSELLRGQLPYTNRSEELGISRSGWSWDVKAGDFTNRGTDELVQAVGFVRGERNRWPQLQELAMGNDELLRYPQVWPNFGPGDDLSGHEHNRFWVRDRSGRYFDLAEAVGIGQQGVSRGVAIGDIDGDGRLDVLVANQWADSLLLRNVSPNTGPAADLRLVAPGAAGGTRAAIGAQVELVDPAMPQKAQLYPANGHAGVSSAEVHLALPSNAPVEVTVSWLDAGGRHRTTVQTWPGHHTVRLNLDGTAEIL